MMFWSRCVLSFFFDDDAGPLLRHSFSRMCLEPQCLGWSNHIFTDASDGERRRFILDLRWQMVFSHPSLMSRWTGLTLLISITHFDGAAKMSCNDASDVARWCQANATNNGNADAKADGPNSDGKMMPCPVAHMMLAKMKMPTRWLMPPMCCQNWCLMLWWSCCCRWPCHIWCCWPSWPDAPWWLMLMLSHTSHWWRCFHLCWLLLSSMKLRDDCSTAAGHSMTDADAWNLWWDWCRLDERYDNVRPVTTTCAEPPRILPQDHLSVEDHRQYRQIVGQLIWASLIRPDLQYPAKTLTRHLQAPSSFDLKNLKHTLRYIKGTQHLRLVLGKDLHRHTGQPLDQLHPLDIKCFTDSDWAGDQETRKSTSGFVISIFNTPLSFSSKTQRCIAQSSAEAELCAMASGVADAFFIKQLLSEIH